jgi:hypothetical protein
MDSGFTYPQWQDALAAAILEFNPNQLRQKLLQAEEAIFNRVHELSLEKGSQRELRLLYDGLSIIQDLKQDRLGTA